MSSGIGCTVFVDGQRLADGALTDDPFAPNALTGLKVTWGRETTMDQPEASTCVFDVVDEPGGSSFAEVLRTGLPVDVTATGTVYPDPTVSTFLDPSFKETNAPVVVSGGTAVVSTRRAATGDQSLRLMPAADRRVSAVLAPAPFVPHGTAPDAWALIPTTAGGQTWSYGASVFAPTYATVQVRPVLFTAPWADAYTVFDEPIAIAGDNTWHVVSADFTPELAGAWVGIQVSVYPAGPTWDQMPSDLSWDAVDPTWEWDDFGSAFVDDITVLAPDEGTSSTVLVFSGRITSLVDAYDDDFAAPVITVTCADFTADLDNRDVGDDPWDVEALADRMRRIIDLSSLPVTLDAPDSIAGTLVSWRDVDSQPAMGLLSGLAASVDGILWSATHQVTGPYFELEDPANRASLSQLEEDDGVVVIVPVGASDDALDLSACDVLRDDVKWTQDTQDVTTRAAVTWKEQGVDEDGKTTTTERTYTIIDGPLEVRLGSRRVSLTSELQAESDAADVAARLLGRSSVIDWRATGLVIDDRDLDDVDAALMVVLLTLLDGTSRNGAALRLVDLPAWTPQIGPAGVYLEGGDYTFDDGAWVLSLTVSNATAQGQSAAWDDLDPAWSWDEFDPSITWDDLRGVGVTTTEGA